MTMTLYLCEKPSQAADIARVLGSATKFPSYWEVNDAKVTWCYGHLLELAAPEAYHERYKQWVFADLPIAPAAFSYVPKKETVQQLKAIGALLRSCTRVVISTDADREGEMIGREVLAYHRYQGKIDRLWLGALDEKNVRKALAQLKAGEETLSLYYAAKARSEADWLVGMNCSRALTLKTARGSGVLSVGRVQTPTVALVVWRDREIEAFTSRPYYGVVVQVKTQEGATVLLRYLTSGEDRIWQEPSAKATAVAALNQVVEFNRECEVKSTPPPKLFSLSGLQKRANTLWGWSAEKTLAVAQSLYEKHKATTYPRTDCEFLPDEQRGDVKTITGNLLQIPSFHHLIEQCFEARNNVFNTSKVTAHHAIIPTAIPAPIDAMDEDERAAFTLIAAQYLASLLPDYEYEATTLSVMCGVTFSAHDVTPINQGWKCAFKACQNDEDGDEETEGQTLPAVSSGTTGTIVATDIEIKKTKPPARYTEGTLIGDMEAVAKIVTDPTKKARLRETSGIGTQATRANIIKTIKDREYVELIGSRKRKELVSTEKGRALIAALEAELPALADPGETAIWEESLECVARSSLQPAQFVLSVCAQIESYLAILAKKPDPPSGQKGTGILIDNVEMIEWEDGFTLPGKFRGKLFKSFWGHSFSADEARRLLSGEQLPLTDLRSKSGSQLSAATVLFNPDKKPWPGVEFQGGVPKSLAQVSPWSQSNDKRFTGKKVIDVSHLFSSFRKGR